MKTQRITSFAKILPTQKKLSSLIYGILFSFVTKRNKSLAKPTNFDKYFAALCKVPAQGCACAVSF
jgi:hypothetical protein